MHNLRTLRHQGIVIATSWVLLGLVLFSLPLAAQAPPSADTFASSTFPTTNFGSVNSLAVAPGSTSYVQFNLGTIPAGATGEQGHPALVRGSGRQSRQVRRVPGHQELEREHAHL